MSDGIQQPKTQQLLLTLAACVIVVAGMKASQAILVPFLLALFIAIISASPLFWLERKGVPPWLAVLIVILVVLLIGIAIGGMVSTAVADFSRNIPFYENRLREQSAGLLNWLAGFGIELSREYVTETFDPGAAMQLVGSMLNSLGGVLTNGFLILLTVVFMLLEASTFPNKLRAILDSPDSSMGRFESFVGNVQRYIAIKTWVSLVTAVLVAAWVWVLGVDYPLLWGLVAFLLNFVPNIGSFIAGVPAVLLALIQLGLGYALATAAGYVMVNVVMGNLIEPRFMGRGLGLSTLVVFLSLIFWGWVLGPVGMLLSVPLTITAKIALDSREDARWLAILLGPEIHKPKQEAEEDA
ncbi:MAG: AI-2E family transporter [Gammaproteobacteria bacterium]|nr:AI-2E family transporter [Gammaproteobacteria bacterium]